MDIRSECHIKYSHLDCQNQTTNKMTYLRFHSLPFSKCECVCVSGSTRIQRGLVMPQLMPLAR